MGLFTGWLVICAATATASLARDAKPVAVSVSPKQVSITSGSTQQFIAKVTGSSNRVVTWNATGGSVSGQGLYTAPATTGAFKVRATSVADPSKYAEANLTVNAPNVVSVEVSPASATVNTGKAQMFTATVKGSSNTAVNWTCMSGAIVAGGLYTAPGIAGNDIVRATSVADGNKYAEALVKVAAGVPGTTEYIQLAQPSGSGPGMNSWGVNSGMIAFSGEKNIVKDVIGGDLIGFVISDSGSHLYAYISQNNGTSWSWMNTGVSSIISASGVAQDLQGKIHILSCQDWNISLQYLRLNVMRDSSNHVTSFSQDASFKMETAGSVGFSQHCQVTAGKDISGNPVLFWGLYSNDSKIYAGKTTLTAGISPVSASDFVALDGTPRETIVVDNGNVLNGDAHNSDFGFAQHPVSKDLWFQWGGMDVGHNQAGVPLKRVRYTPSNGSGVTVWSAGQISTIEQAGSANSNTPQHFSVTSTPNYVWMMRCSNAIGGIVVDRIDVAGNVTTNAFGAISGGYLGWYSLSVDPISENHAWLLGWVSDAASISQNTILIKYFDGSKWVTDWTETLRLDPWGLAGSVGWDNGLSVLLLNYDEHVPYVATLRTY